MARRQRIDSAAAAVKVASAASRQIHPPASVPLGDEDMPFFANVIEEFARSEWTAHQLEVAALLARVMCDMERETRLLREEGSVVTTEKGTPVVNPRKAVVQMHASTLTSYRRTLSLHARAQGGEAREVGKRRQKAKEIEAGLDGGDDGLLAN